MQAFKAGQVNEIVQCVASALTSVLLQADGTGHAITILPGLDKGEKEKVVRRFCKNCSGTISVYTPAPQTPGL